VAGDLELHCRPPRVRRDAGPVGRSHPTAGPEVSTNGVTPDSNLQPCGRGTSRWRELTAAARGVVTVFVVAGILSAPGYSQKAGGAAGRPAVDGPASITSSDASSLLDQIKEVRSPAFRAYLYSNAASRLWRGAGEDQELRRAARDAGEAGVIDIHGHQTEIPAPAAASFYDTALDIVRRQDPAEAARLEKAYPLRARESRSEEERAGVSLHAALAMLGDAKTAARGEEEAVRLVRSGRVPVVVLHGELLRLDRANSLALPQMLSATLALEERSPGTLPLQTMLFLSPLFFRETTPAALSVRFLALVGFAHKVGSVPGLKWCYLGSDTIYRVRYRLYGQSRTVEKAWTSRWTNAEAADAGATLDVDFETR
jgi:hypothetical protein